MAQVAALARTARRLQPMADGAQHAATSRCDSSNGARAAWRHCPRVDPGDVRSRRHPRPQRRRKAPVGRPARWHCACSPRCWYLGARASRARRQPAVEPAKWLPATRRGYDSGAQARCNEAFQTRRTRALRGAFPMEAPWPTALHDSPSATDCGGSCSTTPTSAGTGQPPRTLIRLVDLLAYRPMGPDGC
jgi:hypothetical protein